MILLLHGLFSSFKKLVPLGQRLAGNSISVPLAGHAAGTKVSSMEWKTMTEDLAYQMQRRHITKPTAVVGSSYGGKLLISGITSGLIPPHIPLVLIDILPINYTYRGTLKMVDYMLGNTDRSNGKCLRTINRIPDPMHRMLLLENYQDSPDEPWACQTELIKRDIKPLSGVPPMSPPIPNPTLILRSPISHYVPIKSEAVIRKTFRNYTIETLPNIGHWPHIECPQLCAQIINKFFIQHRSV